MNLPRAFTAALAATAIFATVATAESPAVEQAAAAIKEGQYTRAEDLLTPVVEARHPEAAALYNLAVVRVAQLRYDDAVLLAERATKSDPSKLEYFYLLGSACNARLAEVGPMEGSALAAKMRKAYERVLKINPDHVPSLIGLVRFYERAPEIDGGSPRKAREFAERVQHLDAYLGEIEIGRLAAGRKNFDEALAHYDAAVKLKPDDLGTAAACGWTLFKLGRIDDARARWEAVLKVDPNFGPAKMGLAQTAPAAH